jgi:hypothetical protein
MAHSDWLLVPALLLAAGCGLNKSPEATERSAQTGQVALVVLDPALNQSALSALSSCRSCHAEVQSAERLVSAGWLVPGEPESSPIFTRIDEGTMPPESPFGQARIELIEEWIVSGLALGT